MSQEAFERFMLDVFEHLEYYGYPEMVLDFTPEQIAESLTSIIEIFFSLGQSPRLCALSIFGMTMECQIVPYAKSLKLH